MYAIEFNGIIFYQIKNYENYYVSKCGNVYSSNSNKILKCCYSMGYYHINLYDFNSNKKSIKVHRLVAETFIKNPNNFTDVNHINGIKTDNNVRNLEWCSRSYNCKHACSIGLNKISDRSSMQTGGNHPRAKAVIDNVTKCIYSTVTEASKSIGINRRTLNSMLNGTNKNKTNLSYLDSF